MKESCMQKVREKFNVLPEEEITRHSMYIDTTGKFCFNGAILDICAGIKDTQNSNVGDRLLKEGIYEQDDTRMIIDQVHSAFIESNIEFEDAKDLVLSALSNDGENDYEEWTETHEYLNSYEDDDPYYDDDE